MNSIKWNNFFSLVNDLGKDLNGRKDRFDKADILEIGIQEYSGKKFRWVDEVGYDHICEKTGEKIEVKSQSFCLHTKNGNLKKKTSSIKLTNTLGASGERSYESTFDKLLIIDTGNELSFSAAYVSSNVAEKYIKSSGDGFVIQIPIEELKWLTLPKNITIVNDKQKTNYLRDKRQIQEDFVRKYL